MSSTFPVWNIDFAYFQANCDYDQSEMAARSKKSKNSRGGTTVRRRTPPHKKDDQVLFFFLLVTTLYKHSFMWKGLKKSTGGEESQRQKMFTLHQP